MNDVSIYRILDGSPITLAQDPTHDGLEQVVVPGAWKGHWQGEFQITEAMLEQMADAGNSRKIATPCDYGHELTYNSAAAAAGWIEPGGFSIEGKGKKAALFAKVTWTEAARQKITAGELRYKSPTILFNTVDRKTGRMGGASLHSVALTNTPFLHELPEVRLNSIMAALRPLHAKEPKMNEEQIKKLAALLGLAEDATAEQILAAMDGKTIVAASELQSLQLKATATEGSAQQIAALQNKLQSMEQAQRDRDALGLVREMQAARKVAGDETDNFKVALDHAKRDPEGFRSLMATMSAWVPGPADTTPISKTDSSALLDEQQRVINQRLGLSDEVFAKHNK